MRIGVDLGGTKIEAIALADDGAELARIRIPAPRQNYDATIGAIAGLVGQVEAAASAPPGLPVGIGMPGCVSPLTGLVKNANSTWLNGRPFHRDMAAALGRPVRCENDANCLAVSEATDGAGAGAHVVFAVIIGTGAGGGVAIGSRVHKGPNAAGGEWGHNPLPWMRPEEYPGPTCYCGKPGCLENWISGTGLQLDYRKATGRELKGFEVVAAARQGQHDAVASLDRYVDRLGRAIAHLVNLLDPDVIVLGGGMSNVDELYPRLPDRVRAFVFGGEFDTPIRKAVHGDSSGVRGAAWLWPVGGEAGVAETGWAD